jgi:hypothetical protein
VISCYGNDSCPPGTVCKGGACQTLNKIESAEERGAEFLIEKAKDKAVEKWLEMFTEMAEIRIPAALSSLFGKIVNPFVLGVFDARPMSLNLDGYDKTMRTVGSDLVRLRQLYQELHDYYQHKPARAPAMISADIKSAKRPLREHLELLNTYYVGVIKEKELSRYSCQNVFEFQTQLVNQSIVNILSLPEPESP